MTIKFYPEIRQGSDEWFALRCGMLTASKMERLITPTLKIAANNDSRAIVSQLVTERITGHVEDTFVSYDMERGKLDEIAATQLYNKEYAELSAMGFVTNDKFGYMIGCSPDGLLLDGSKGVQAKSRKNRFQLETILADEMPKDYLIQVQTEMLVMEYDEWDFISYSGGMPMYVKTIKTDRVVQDAIKAAADQFEESAAMMIGHYHRIIEDPDRKFIPTERRVEDIQA